MVHNPIHRQISAGLVPSKHPDIGGELQDNGLAFLLRDNQSLFGTTGPVKAIAALAIIGLIVNVAFSWPPSFTQYPFVSPPGINANLFSINAGMDSNINALPARQDGEAVVRKFFEAGDAADVDAVIPFLVVENGTMSRIEQLFGDRRLFRGYEGLNTGDWRYEKSTLPRRESLALQGGIQYETGPDGSFQATLVKDSGVWKLRGLQISR